MASSPIFETSSGAVSPANLETVSNDERTLRPMREMMRYKALVARTVDAFGDEIKASRWLSLPNRDFDGQTPLQVAQKNGYDLQAIEPILIRIEHGVDF
jgi:uncharacterized protein (DUF2384 family)